MPTAIAGVPAVASETHTNANETIEWTLDSRANRVRVLFEGNAGKVGFTATEGQAFAGAAYVGVAADTIMALMVDGSVARINDLKVYTSADVGGTVVRLLIDRG